ncbi:glycerophosphodiester phosphodiesterase [Acinetobacter boissieri]|uniref:glycerophosphodiester phosphodiesterase n=1 Tax=Acinetobacter boissieri TaxID=1219383 RepID=A0A1G6HJB3_9GAMM|nr:glycerophosphodiester phosphodiesterase [Acinetobacter boissieri]SDB94349.1 glycerophosphoryl diester phosphodiesterase [Acinetobacter boissieri]
MKKKTILANMLFSILALTQYASAVENMPSLAVQQGEKVLVIAHRGASALRPEHTLASYQKAIDDGADFIEPDLVSTKDGMLVARHENEIGGTSNISTLPQFAQRQTTKVIDGKSIQGWFTEDFTAKELQQVKARERIPKLRPENTKYNDQYNIPTLKQIIELAENHYKKTGKVVGLYIETKHPTFFKNQHLAMEDTLLKTLAQNNYSKNIAPIYLQSFETTNIQYMKQKLNQYGLKHVQIIQLYDDPKMIPGDLLDQGAKTTYADLATVQGLTQVAKYADGVGPSKIYIIDKDTQQSTSFVQNAHALGLKVHPYTFRPENNFLPPQDVCSQIPSERCERGSVQEIKRYLNTGIDGFFTDDPKLGRDAMTQP